MTQERATTLLLSCRSPLRYCPLRPFVRFALYPPISRTLSISETDKYVIQRYVGAGYPHSGWRKTALRVGVPSAQERRLRKTAKTKNQARMS
jgi:hypothetical protein